MSLSDEDTYIRRSRERRRDIGQGNLVGQYNPVFKIDIPDIVDTDDTINELARFYPPAPRNVPYNPNPDHLPPPPLIDRTPPLIDRPRMNRDDTPAFIEGERVARSKRFRPIFKPVQSDPIPIPYPNIQIPSHMRVPSPIRIPSPETAFDNFNKTPPTPTTSPTFPASTRDKISNTPEYCSISIPQSPLVRQITDKKWEQGHIYFLNNPDSDLSEVKVYEHIGNDDYDYIHEFYVTKEGCEKTIKIHKKTGEEEVFMSPKRDYP